MAYNIVNARSTYPIRVLFFPKSSRCGFFFNLYLFDEHLDQKRPVTVFLRV